MLALICLLSPRNIRLLYIFRIILVYVIVIAFYICISLIVTFLRLLNFSTVLLSITKKKEMEWIKKTLSHLIQRCRCRGLNSCIHHKISGCFVHRANFFLNLLI